MKDKIINYFICFVIMAFLCLITIIPVSTAEVCASDICVNTTGWWRDSGAFNASATPIQHAVDNAVTGDTVYVWNGTYAENVAISTAITLEGEDNSTTIVRSPSSESNGITISSNDVTLKDICINHCSTCIYLSSVENCTIKNIITRGDYPTNRSSYDVRMYSSTNMVIDNNRFASVRPIYISSSNNITFTNNILSPSIQSYTTAEMLNLNDSVIEYNTFNKGYEGGLKITGAINVSVKNNAFPSGKLYLTNFNDSNVMYNIVSPSKVGLHLTSSENVNISHNVHTGTIISAGSSIGIFSSNAIILHNNSITSDGIYYSGAGFKISNSVNITATNTTIETPDSELGPFILISGTTKEHYNHSIDTSNTLFGEPMYYYFNNPSVSLHDISSNYLKLAYCNNAALNNMTFYDMWYLDRNIVQSDAVQITNSDFTIRLESSDHAYISNHKSYVYVDSASTHATITHLDGDSGLMLESGTNYVTLSYYDMNSGTELEMYDCDHGLVEHSNFYAWGINDMDNFSFINNTFVMPAPWGGVTNSYFYDNDFSDCMFDVHDPSSYNTFEDNIFRHGFMAPLAISDSNSVGNTFSGTQIKGLNNPSISISGGSNNVFTDTTFEYAANAVSISGGSQVNFIQNDNRVFVTTTGYTIANTTATNLTVANGLYDYRPFWVTPSAGELNIISTPTWETSGIYKKEFNITGTSGTFDYIIGDMGPNTDVTISTDTWSDTKTANATGYITGTYDGGWSTQNFIVQELPPTYIPPDPISLVNDTGNFWVNFTFAPGSGNVTDSFNISTNNGSGIVWDNGSLNTSINESVGAHGYLDIIVYAWNNSGTGTLSSGYITDNVTVPNNNITITNTSDYDGMENVQVLIDFNYTDVDSDTPLFQTNATVGSLNSSTGIFTWTPTSGDIGTHYFEFNVSDGYGSVDSYIAEFIIKEFELTSQSPENNAWFYKGNTPTYSILASAPANSTWTLDDVELDTDDNMNVPECTIPGDLDEGLHELVINSAMVSNLSVTDEYIWSFTIKPTEVISSGGSSGSSVSSDVNTEPSYNVLCKEFGYINNIKSNDITLYTVRNQECLKVTSVSFVPNSDSIQEIVYIEGLIDRSYFISKDVPNHEIFNFNLFIGSLGYTHKTKYEEISFKLEKTVIIDNELDENTVSLYKWSSDNEVWVRKYTELIDSDESYYYYKSDSDATTGNFAIAGEELIPEEEPLLEEIENKIINLVEPDDAEGSFFNSIKLLMNNFVAKYFQGSAPEGIGEEEVVKDGNSNLGVVIIFILSLFIIGAVSTYYDLDKWVISMIIGILLIVIIYILLGSNMISIFDSNIINIFINVALISSVSCLLPRVFEETKGKLKWTTP